MNRSTRASTLPLKGKTAQQYKTKKELYHISFASECQRCFETCVKPRRLPCEDEFCKSCLKAYFNKEIEDDIAQNTFPCPACNKPIQKPLMPKSKWTKSFKIDKTSLFYADRPLSTSSLDKKTNHPTDQFGCKINTESYPCAFWGGDVCSSGEIFLPDWYNSKVKVFNENGTLMSFAEIYNPPLDVTVLPDNTVVVSYGSATKRVTLTQYENGQLGKLRNVSIQGHLYNTTRLGNRCLGILEHENNTVTLATVSANGKVRLLDLGSLSRSIATSSGLCYNKSTKRIYLTQKNNFICLDSGGKLIFEKSYPLREKDHHFLGSVTCDQRNSVYIACDEGVLQVDSGGTFIRLMLTTFNPFYVMVSCDSSRLYVVGRNDRVEICQTDVLGDTDF